MKIALLRRPLSQVYWFCEKRLGHDCARPVLAKRAQKQKVRLFQLLRWPYNWNAVFQVSGDLI